MSDIDGDAETDPVTSALVRVVADFGPSVIYSPGRLRASLSDVLGSVGRLHRAEVDALEIAAEEHVSSELDGGSSATAQLEERLAGRGLTPEMARFAVAAWRAALGGTGVAAAPVAAAPVTAVPPAVRSTPDLRAGGGPGEASGRHTDEVPVATLVRSAMPVGGGTGAAPTEAVPARATVAPGPDAPAPRRRRPVLIAGVAAGLLLPLAGVGTYAYLGHRTGTTAGDTDPSTWTRLPTDEMRLSLESAAWVQPVPYGWAGSNGCTIEQAAPTGVAASPCVMQLDVQAIHVPSTWRITDVHVYGAGRAWVVGDHALAYVNPSNGPYSAMVSFRAEGDGVQATSTWRLETSCNTHFACEK